MSNYKEKLLDKLLDRIIADIEMDIYQHLEILFTKLILDKDNRKMIGEYLAAGK